MILHFRKNGCQCIVDTENATQFGDSCYKLYVIQGFGREKTFVARNNHGAIKFLKDHGYEWEGATNG